VKINWDAVVDKINMKMLGCEKSYEEGVLMLQVPKYNITDPAIV
jgi:hypothetical protein